MKVLIQTPNFRPSKKLIRFTNEKVETLNRYFDRIVESHVHLKKLNTTVPENKVCEIRLAIPGNDLFVSKSSSSFEEAISKTVDVIKRQLGDRKD